jgi:hypothetical protein
MRKILTFLFIILLSSNMAFADDGDLWDNFGDSNFYGQKAVSDQDFDKALESKQKKKKRDKNIPKGQSFSQSNETNMIKNSNEELPVLLIPVTLKVDGKYLIPIGHYQVEGVKENGEVFINLYQSHDVIAKLPAEETDDDFGEETINFVKLLPHGDYHVEIRYGGVNFNAYTIVDIE